MGAPGGPRLTCGERMSDCVDTDHFQEIDGVIAPQPWMQWRNVGTIEAPTRTAALGATITDDAAGNQRQALALAEQRQPPDITHLFSPTLVRRHSVGSPAEAGEE